MNRYIFLILIFTLSLAAFSVNTTIYSSGSHDIETLSLFLGNGNKSLGRELTDEFARIYVEEADKEGINWDVAFVQMCLETGFLKFSNLVSNTQNNFCGLGSFGSNKGASFSTIREGIRAHIQHLKAYSTTESLVHEQIDPRFHLVERGIANDVSDLTGRWATDPKYGYKLTNLLKKINFFKYETITLIASTSLDSIDSIDKRYKVVDGEKKKKWVR